MPYPYYGYTQPMQDTLNQYKMQSPMQGYQQQVQPTDSRIWVQGEVGAKSYLVANANTVVLWDSEAPMFYVKSMVNGMPTMQKYNYAVVQEQKQTDMNQYVTKEYLDERLKEVMQHESDGIIKKSTVETDVKSVQK